MEPIHIGTEKLTLAQAAKICGVSRVTMWRWVKFSNLKSATTAGGHHRIARSDLLNFIKNKNMERHVRSTIHQPRILVVDDDPHVQKLLVRMLLAKGYDVAACSNGFEAGILVMKFQPQLVVLDLFMPQLDGFQVCKLLKKDPSTADIIILAISGNAHASNIERVKECGADRFFQKPLSKDLFLETVEQMLAFSSSLELD